MMKAAVYLGKEKVKLRELPLPEVKGKDVLLQNICSSVCGTDVAVYLHGPGTGHKVDVGGEFGHETVCRVAAVGPDVTEFTVGERVYPYPLLVTGDTARAGTIGAFSEYILARDARRGVTLYPVDEKIPDRVACLIEPFTVGCRAAKQGNPRPGEKAVVFGCGTIGIAAAMTLRHLGVEEVMLCDLSAFRLGIAKKLGFTVCHTGEEDFAAKAAAYFGEGYSLSGKVPDIDCWVDAAGAEAVAENFAALGKIGARLVHVAVSKGKREIDLLHLVYSSQSIIGSGGYRPEDVRTVMEIMKSGRWDIGSIITHSFPLEKIDEALRTAADTDRAFNVMVTF